MSESLGFPSREQNDFFTRFELGDIRLVRRGGRVAGGLFLLPCGQFFGGQRVPMVGVHAVAIAPEARGSGAGRELVQAMIGDLTRPGGPALAALFPATQPIYRSVGFEQAGSFTRYRIPIAGIPIGPHDLEVERLEPDPVAAAALLGDHYRRLARGQNGFVDRTPWFWGRAVDPLTGPVTTFAVRESGTVTGHAILSRRWTSDGQAPRIEVVCRELLASTPAAARRLWTLLADERSLGRTLLVTGPPATLDPFLFAEQVAEVHWHVLWMLRILDVEAALAGRGYPPGLSLEVHLDVEDDMVARNRGRFAVEVAGGRAQVRRLGEKSGAGSTSGVRLGIRALASLYSGHLGGEALARAGMASGEPEALAAVTALFAGTPPWLPEMF